MVRKKIGPTFDPTFSRSSLRQKIGPCALVIRRPLTIYSKQTSGEDLDPNDKYTYFQILQKNTHIVAKYFDLRTLSYFKHVMGPLFGVNSYWYRQEFAKSRGMVHWHGLCWCKDRKPHNLMYEVLKYGLSDEICAEKLAKWATDKFGMTASHPAGSDHNGLPRKDFWPPPEGSAPCPPEDKNPLIKFLMDVSQSQESLLDHLLLTNRINLHRCSDYCLRKQGYSNNFNCRLEFGTKENPGKPLRSESAIVRDKNKSLRSKMPRDHPMLVQHSRFHTQGWRANGDISVILSKSDPNNPSVNEIMATEKYISGYACKGNQPTGAIANLFNDMVNCCNDSSGVNPKSLITKLLMESMKRDVSSVEASYELCSLPLYRSSHNFQSVSLSGARIIESNGSTITKNTQIDKYLARSQDDTSSLYNFICRRGRVPVISGINKHATWPLSENYCKSTILLHWPNWRLLSDIKSEDMPWQEKMIEFLNTEHCPNFIRADREGKITK